MKKSLRTNASFSILERGALGSLEMTLVMPVYLLVWVMLVESVKWGYVNMDALIAARNSAWKKELYLPQDDQTASLINVDTLLLDAVTDSSSVFLNGEVRNVHQPNVVAYSEYVEVDKQKNIVSSFRSGLQAVESDLPELLQTDSTIPDQIDNNVRGWSSMLDDYPFRPIRATAVYPKIDILGLYSSDQPGSGLVEAVFTGNWRDALGSLIGARLTSTAHYADFAAGWELITEEMTESPDAFGDKRRRVFTKGYDAKLLRTIYPRNPANPQDSPRIFTKPTFPRYDEIK